MVSLHLWPRTVKRLIMVTAVLLVIIAYTTLCSGLLALVMLFS